MKRLLKEPLLHFLILGAAIFAAYSWMSKPAGNEPGKIVVSRGQVESMMVTFTRTWQRPPTLEELERLIRDRVREEVLCREAMAMGLEKDDTVIRRRLRQKMEFVTEDVSAQAEPTDAELSDYLNAHPEQFRVQRQFTFSQVYLNPERHRENLQRDAEELLAHLRPAVGKADAVALGDQIMLEHSFVALPASEIAKQFGDKFAARLGELPPGQWQGPVESGFGLHLVLISERKEGRLPALAEVREAVHHECANARRVAANEQLYADMLKRYEVTIERPVKADEKKIAEAKRK